MAPLSTVQLAVSEHVEQWLHQQGVEPASWKEYGEHMLMLNPHFYMCFRHDHVLILHGEGHRSWRSWAHRDAFEYADPAFPDENLLLILAKYVPG